MGDEVTGVKFGHQQWIQDWVLWISQSLSSPFQVDSGHSNAFSPHQRDFITNFQRNLPKSRGLHWKSSTTHMRTHSNKFFGLPMPNTTIGNPNTSIWLLVTMLLTFTFPPLWKSTLLGLWTWAGMECFPLALLKCSPLFNSVDQANKHFYSIKVPFRAPLTSLGLCVDLPLPLWSSAHDAAMEYIELRACCIGIVGSACRVWEATIKMLVS